MSYRKTILIDFDGVLHSYDGEFSSQLGPPVEKSRHACVLLSRKFKLVCFTSRLLEQVEPWLKRYAFPDMLVTNEKLPAFLIIDDRAITFKGAWTDEFLEEVKQFKPHWQHVALADDPTQFDGESDSFNL